MARKTEKRGPALTAADLEQRAATPEAGGDVSEKAGTGPAAPVVPAVMPEKTRSEKRAERRAARQQGGKEVSAARKPAGVQTLAKIAAAAVFVALVAVAYGVYAHVTSAARYATLEAETHPVVVAAGEIAEGHVIGVADVVVKELPATAVPEGSASKVEDVVGRTATTAIVKNAPVTKSTVTGDAASTVADRTDGGMVAISVTVSQAKGVAGLLHQGDYVTVYAMDALGGEGVLEVAQHARVLALDTNLDGYDAAYTGVTLEVSKVSAKAIAGVAGDVYLAVESGADAPERI